MPHVRKLGLWWLTALLCVGIVISILLTGSLVSWDKAQKVKPLYPPLPWYVDRDLRSSDEVHHVAFVKVHKAASSTLYSAFIRFSLSRNLNVIFPLDGHLLSEKETTVAKLVSFPPTVSFHYHILCNHMVFDLKTVKHLLPPDSVYITIVREPLRQVKSAYDYYKTKYNESYLIQSANFSDFLVYANLYEPTNPYQSFTNNRMSLDLGLPPNQIRNISYIPTFLRHLDNVFHLVLIAERFDESMVLLKRRLRWTMKDIVYIKLNQRKVVHSERISPFLEGLFKVRDQFDVAVYSYFWEKFDMLVDEEGSDFQEEVITFQGITASVAAFCEMYNPEAVLLLPTRKWNREFIFSANECETIHMDDLSLNDRAKYWQIRRLNETVT